MLLLSVIAAMDLFLIPNSMVKSTTAIAVRRVLAVD
jgi:hypothetical protein